MDRDFEGKIRSKIEAVLVNDGRNSAEIRAMSSADEPMEVDPFSEERNLYQRIINNYRNAVSEVNSLLEENLNYVSGLGRILETIKDKDDLQEICLRVIDCALQDLGAEFCSVVIDPSEKCAGNTLFLEGLREEHKLLFSHSNSTLLGSRDLAQVVEKLIAENSDCLNIEDVYRDPRFNSIDFPSVVRSLICLPVHVHKRQSGALVLSHSLPRYFTQNHSRVLKILAATISHLLLLTDRNGSWSARSRETPPERPAKVSEPLSLILLRVECAGLARTAPLEREDIRDLHRSLSQNLEPRESILHYDEAGLLILLPGTPTDQLFDRASSLRGAFETWKTSKAGIGSELTLSLGCATCTNWEDLTRALEAASQRLNGNNDEEHSVPVQSELPRM